MLGAEIKDIVMCVMGVRTMSAINDEHHQLKFGSRHVSVLGIVTSFIHTITDFTFNPQISATLGPVGREAGGHQSVQERRSGGGATVILSARVYLAAFVSRWHISMSGPRRTSASMESPPRWQKFYGGMQWSAQMEKAPKQTLK